MSVKVPSAFDFDIDADLSGAVTATLAGLPSHYTLSIDKLPKIEAALAPIEFKPLDLSLRIREFPSIRAHLPADFKVGLSLLGVEFLTLRLCGKALAITEPFRPNPCEVCGAPERTVGAMKPPTLNIGEG